MSKYTTCTGVQILLESISHIGALTGTGVGGFLSYTIQPKIGAEIRVTGTGDTDSQKVLDCYKRITDKWTRYTIWKANAGKPLIRFAGTSMDWRDTFRRMQFGGFNEPKMKPDMLNDIQPELSRSQIVKLVQDAITKKCMKYKWLAVSVKESEHWIQFTLTDAATDKEVPSGTPQSDEIMHEVLRAIRNTGVYVHHKHIEQSTGVTTMTLQVLNRIPFKKEPEDKKEPVKYRVLKSWSQAKGDHQYDERMCQNNQCKIIKVKRIPDLQTFEVGQEITFDLNNGEVKTSIVALTKHKELGLMVMVEVLVDDVPFALQLEKARAIPEEHKHGYEIVKYISNESGIHDPKKTCKTECFIYQVKRISDGEIFTVGQEVKDKHGNVRTIRGFTKSISSILKDTCIVRVGHEFEQNGIWDIRDVIPMQPAAKPDDYMSFQLVRKNANPNRKCVLRIRYNTEVKAGDNLIWRVINEDWKEVLAEDVEFKVQTFTTSDRLPDGRMKAHISCYCDNIQWNGRKLVVS